MGIIEQLASIWLAGIGIDFLRYLLGAGLTFLITAVVLKKRLRARKIQPHTPSARQIGREFVYSLSTAVIFASVGIASFLGPLHESMKVYDEIEDFGWAYAGLSLVLVLVLHDTYFYWAHRLMHLTPLFRHVHRVHHLSHTPTPWAAYAFAPPEALLHALFLPLVALWLPLHPLVMFAFLAIMILRNALGHSGVEVFPGGFTRGWLRWSTTVTHHDLHHQNPRANYGLYFTWWDRWMGTEKGDYEARFKSVTSSPVVAAQLPAGDGR